MDAQTLLQTLKALTADQLELFKWNLQRPENIVGNLGPLAEGELEEAKTWPKVVNLIMAKYPNDALEIVIKALRMIGRNDLANDLENRVSGVERPQATGVDAPGKTAVSGVERPQSTQAIDEQYKLNSKPTGLCVIMHNENFKNPKDNRNGTDKDAGDLARTFSWLGFRVLMCKDQTKGQMEESLKRFSSKDLTGLQRSSVKEWSGWAFTDLNVNDVPQHGDAFVCCIMSHGDEGCVKGTDKGSVYIKDITKTFNGQNCNVLVGKPKVFFIQACQGNDIQSAILAADNIPELQDRTPVVKLRQLVPVDADFLVFMATVENYVSFRHPEEGTWFMQSVCKQLKEGCHSGDDLCTILRRVNNEVSQKVEILENLEKAIQMPEFKGTLRKRLVFSPIDCGTGGGASGSNAQQE